MRPRKVETARRTHRPRSLNRLAVAACVAALSLGTASSTAASVTIGQLAPSTPGSGCISSFDRLQPTVTSGNSYTVPALPPASALVVSSWSHNAAAGAGQMVKLKVFRQVTGLTYNVVGHDGPRPITPSTVNTFSGLSIPVKSGDVLGLNGVGPNYGCSFLVTGDGYLFKMGDLADGGSGTFSPTTNLRLNVAAVIAPANIFTFGGTTRNKKKGTATLSATVPNPGELTGSGKGVKIASAAGAVISKSVTAGPAQLLIKAKGKKKRKLNQTGKVKVKPKITYTPTGGDPSTQSIKVKLKKKL